MTRLVTPRENGFVNCGYCDCYTNAKIRRCCREGLWKMDHLQKRRVNPKDGWELAEVAYQEKLKQDEQKEMGTITKNETVNSLRKKGYKVKVFHIRTQKGLKRNSFAEKGGITQVEIFTPDRKILAFGSALCSQKDQYCKKTGVRFALDRAIQDLNYKILDAVSEHANVKASVVKEAVEKLKKPKVENAQTLLTELKKTAALYSSQIQKLERFLYDKED